MLRTYYITQLAPVALQCYIGVKDDGAAFNEFQAYLNRVGKARTYRLVREDRKPHENGSNLVRTTVLSTRHAQRPLTARVREFLSPQGLDRLWADIAR